MKDNKDYLIGGALVIAGGIAAATGFGGSLGTMLIGAGADMIIQRATTGSVNYIEAAVSGLLGAAGGAGGSALAGRLGLKGVWAAAASGAGAGALPGGTMSGYSYMSSPGPHTPAGFLQATATGTLEGGVTGGLGGAAGHGLAHVFGNAIGRSVMADPRILSGHGGIHASSGSTFTVPKGVTVRFYSPHDTRISDSVGNTIETGTRRWPFSNVQPTPYEVAGPGTIWLELNKIGVWWCDWEVLEVVVEGAVGDVGGEGREGVLWGERAGVGDIVLGGVPHVFCGTQGRGRRGACRWA